MAQTLKTVAMDLGTNDREWFDGIAYDSGADKLTIDMTALDSGIRPSDADCAVATGDIREVLYGILSHIVSVEADRADIALAPPGDVGDVLVGMVTTQSDTMTSSTLRRTTFKFVFTRDIGDKDTFALANPIMTVPGIED